VEGSTEEKGREDYLQTYWNLLKGSGEGREGAGGEGDE
jgi:hypothetical protein